MRLRTWLASVAVLGPLAITVACGSRTALFLSSTGGSGVGVGVGNDDDAGDASLQGDGQAPPGDDAPSIFDAPIVIVPVDAPIDSTVPLIDAATPEAGLSCADSSLDNAAYLVSQGGTLYRFNPATLVAVPVASLPCTGVSSVPFTMTVTEGAAYVMDDDSSLYRVDLGTFACTRTPFDPTSIAFTSELALASAYVNGKESLLIFGCAQTEPEKPCVGVLARVDLTTFAIDGFYQTVQPLPANLMFPVDMKADGYGRLFSIDFTGTLLQIDPPSGNVVGIDETGFTVSSAEALLTWNGSIFLFGNTTGQIDTFDLATKKLTRVGQVGDAIVGAGSAPCLH